MLSKEKEDLINKAGLYKHKPEEKYRGKLYSNDLYHCCNWTFKPFQCKDGSWVMMDTYWNGLSDSVCIKLNDDNFNEFEFVFDFREVEQTNCPEEYDNEDLFCHIATNSGGYNCGHLDWIKKDAKKSKAKLIQKAQKEIDYAKWCLESAEKDLQQLMDGTHWKLK